MMISRGRFHRQIAFSIVVTQIDEAASPDDGSGPHTSDVSTPKAATAASTTSADANVPCGAAS